jgi:hypothetical protein
VAQRPVLLRCVRRHILTRGCSRRVNAVVSGSDRPEHRSPILRTLARARWSRHGFLDFEFWILVFRFVSFWDLVCFSSFGFVLRGVVRYGEGMAWLRKLVYSGLAPRNFIFSARSAADLSLLPKLFLEWVVIVLV